MVEDVLVLEKMLKQDVNEVVLILVVVEDVLVHDMANIFSSLRV